MRRFSRVEQDQILYEREQLEQELTRLNAKLKTVGEYEYASTLTEINRIKRKLYRLRNL